MKLLIVESPSKAKTIEKYLDGEYVVRASVGHVRDLPKSNKNAVDIEHGFKPHYVLSPKKKEVVFEIGKLAKKADEIVLATDPDREGEAIAWHVMQALELDGDKRVKRVAFNEITKDAVQEALKHPRDIDDHLLHAQEARRVLDRLVGYDLSGLIWKKVRYGLSAGRVQSPALRIIMEREREIRAFVPEDYWTITANLCKDSQCVEFECSKEPREEDRVKEIVALGKDKQWSVRDVVSKETTRKPYPPFKTSTLQRVASSRLGFSPSRTMRAAQKLYEKGLITYMRTDSTTLSKQALGYIGNVVEKEYGKKYLNITQYKTKSKSAQEAHEAIRPTNPSKRTGGHTDDEKKVYDLIWTRAVSSQMKPAEMIRTKITAGVEADNFPNFEAHGTRITFDGWLACNKRARGEENELFKTQKDEILQLDSIQSEAKQTQPPNRYSEAGIIKELEKRGIGRPSTYASILKTLQDRGYVQKEGNALHPTDTGDVVSSFLEENFMDYIDDDFTAEMEDKLDDIAAGDAEYEKTVRNYYTPFHKVVENKKDIPKITDLGPADEKFKCPECESSMVIKLGRSGKFLSCNRFPDCEGARTMNGTDIKPNEPLGIDPESGEPVFLLDGRYGPYVQLGEPVRSGKNGKKKKPKRASVPQDKNPEDITLEDALKYLSLPRTLGTHPETGKEITASVGRFGPYIAHHINPKPDYRSLKPARSGGRNDDVYTITLERALEILKEPKKRRGGRKKKKK